MKTKHRNAANAKRSRRWQADPSAMQRVIARTTVFTAAEVQELALPVRLAYESLRTGVGNEDDCDTLAIAVNAALVRSESIDPLCEQTCIDAQDGLMRAKARFAATGRWGFDGLAMQSIPLALDLHEQMLSLSSPAQMIEAQQEVLARMARGQVRDVSK